MSWLPWYYMISGIITMTITNFCYQYMVKEVPLIGYINKNILILIQFFTGFIQFPFIVILGAYNLFLQLIIWQKTKENKRLEEENKHLLKLNQEQQKRTIVLRDIYEKYIEVQKEFSDNHEFYSPLAQRSITVRQIKDSMLWMYDEKFKRMTDWDMCYYIVIKDNLYLPTCTMRLQSLTDQGWEILLACKNIFY